jgi:hypothetical protein
MEGWNLNNPSLIDWVWLVGLSLMLIQSITLTGASADFGFSISDFGLNQAPEAANPKSKI